MHAISKYTKKKKWFQQNLLALSLVFIFSVFFQLFLRQYFLKPMIFNSSAMEKSIPVGTLVFLEEKNYDFLEPGDVVRISHPSGGEIFCRVRATEGSRVYIRGGEFYLNHKKVHFWPKRQEIFPTEMSSRDFFPETEIRPGYIFCLHDNPEHIYDSRTWGALPISWVTGKIKYKGWFWKKV